MASIVSYTKAKLDTLLGLKADAATVGAVSAASAEVRAGYAARWQPEKPYTVGFPVLNPSGQIATALQNHTSGTTYDASKWQLAGVATLDSNGKILVSQMPPLAINDTFVVASQAAMLALTAQRGDMARRTDTTPAKLFVLAADDATVAGNWIEITASGAVTSVDGQAGTVVLGAVAATNDALARRSSTGTLAAATATAAGELTTKGQVDAAFTATNAVVAEVNSKAIAVNTITSTTRPASPVFGVRYKESDTGDIVSWTGTRWQKVGGLPRSVASNPNSGGTGNIGVTAGAGAVLAARSLSIPAHVPGTLRVQYTGIWYATGGQALWGHLRLGTAFASAPEVESTRMRSHNNGVANAPTWLHCEGHWNSDGTAAILWLATYVEAAVTTAMVDGAIRIWVEGLEL